MRPDPRFWTLVTSGGALEVTVTTLTVVGAAGKFCLATATAFSISRSSVFPVFSFGSSRRFSRSRSMPLQSVVEGTDPTEDPYRGLKVFDPSGLKRYYKETKRILLLQENTDTSRRPGTVETNSSRNLYGNGDENRLEGATTPTQALSSLSLRNPPRKIQSETKTASKVFSLKHLEPRHRKSMMRCVLNHFHSQSGSNESNSNSSKSNSKERTTIVTKADFQHRLRLVDRRQKWTMARRLLFGEITVDATNNDGALPRLYWWESDVIEDEKAPGLVEGIRNYKNSWDNPPVAASAAALKMVDEDSIDPKKFLSRLARGRAYKGNFRTLLEEHAAATATATAANGRCDLKLILLYDKIGGGNAKSNATVKPSWKESNQHELELLRLFIDELEEDAGAEAERSPASTMDPSRIVVGTEQISLLRTICDLDIFSSPPPKSVTSQSSGVPALDDGGRSVGKKGELDLETFLVGKQRAETSCTSESESSSCSSTTRILSPVWVRPKHKNRRNTKQKCQYVLEIPKMTKAKAESSSSSSNKTMTGNGLVSSGTTSEFDAMVVRVIGIKDTNINENEGHPLPIMAIQEVWDAKATLDPSALLDVLDKKVGSLQKILCDENSRVVNISDSSFVTEDGRISSMLAMDYGSDPDKAANEGANFVVLPRLEHQKDTHRKSHNNNNNNNDVSATSSTMSSLPMVYRVGIEPTFRTENKDDDNCDDCNTDPRLFPQIGVFASRMIGPGSAARRIQTIVYERLLETDIATVQGVVLRHRRSHDMEQGEGGDPVAEAAIEIQNGENRPLRCNRLVRDRSVEIIERILRLIDTQRPIVVVGILPSSD